MTHTPRHGNLAAAILCENSLWASLATSGSKFVRCTSQAQTFEWHTRVQQGTTRPTAQLSLSVGAAKKV
jgi:hypothetical protein